jgi:hypothetical protein
MRARPVRPNIYLPVVRFGVADSDWFSVLLVSCAGYLLPVPLGITVLYVPLQMWTWLIATAASIAFFNYIRIGKRPHWPQHKVSVLVSHHRQSRSLPNGKKRPFDRPWLNETNIGISFGGSHQTRAAEIPLLLEHNNRIQEAGERWKEVSVSTT